MPIIYSKSAIKFLQKQNATVQQRILGAITQIPTGNIKKLKKINGYRLRIGKYRVIYDINNGNINIIDIDNRGQVYK
ncbi:MAG: type II toxin-antitoxin system RelE/ParE family toxin [Firmicutes bacterium]|nr:type II toxin-antitoxin system RelE/ParE family toxin [Bacillota bacterium]